MKTAARSRFAAFEAAASILMATAGAGSALTLSDSPCGWEADAMPESPLDDRELMESARAAHVSSRQQQQHDVTVNGARATGSAMEPRSGKDTRRARRCAAFHVSFSHSSFVGGKPPGISGI